MSIFKRRRTHTAQADNTVHADRRQFLLSASALGVLAALETLAPGYAWASNGKPDLLPTRKGKDDIFHLTIKRETIEVDGIRTQAVTINGTVPGPLLRLQEGRNAVIHVKNELDEDTSIHWHGLILPYQMDGVPGVTFPGIKAGETFTYRFPVTQAGTYWYHSHSGLQEQLGHYAPIVIEPAGKDLYQFDRDYVVVLSDWTFKNPTKLMAKLKKSEGYFNHQKRTVVDFLTDIKEIGWGAAWAKAGMWGNMRMSSRDLLDITGAEYTYLMNGLAPDSNWSGLFKKGEKVRLRFINAGAMTLFDVRIPGLKMTVVQADGQNVQPVEVDEFRIGNAETYDVIVEPTADQAYTIFAEAMDRSGYARGTLAPREGMVGAIPPPRQISERGMNSMGAGHEMHMEHGNHAMDKHTMSGSHNMTPPSMDHGMDHGTDHSAHNGHNMQQAAAEMDHSAHATAVPDHSGHNMGDMPGMNNHGEHGSMGMDSHSSHTMPAASAMSADYRHGDHHGPGAAMIVDQPVQRLDDPGVGLHSTADHKVLVYRDLKAHRPWPDQRAPAREIELHLTGNMERYMWSFDGRKFSEVDSPIMFKHGERLRLVLINDTMMDHPIHLHGMWMELENGHGDLRPRKHTIIVKPGEKVAAQITADAMGDWAFHCHLMYHMKAGMFRVVRVA